MQGTPPCAQGPAYLQAHSGADNLTRGSAHSGPNFHDALGQAGRSAALCMQVLLFLGLQVCMRLYGVS